MNIFQNIWLHPKTSVAGLLIAVISIAGVLSQQGITLGTAGTGTIVALIGAIATALLGLLAAAGFTVVRDGIRDLTLSSHSYDVWQQTVVTNWPVVSLFLVLFVAGLAAVGWLVSVMMRAKPISEKVV